MRASDPDTTHRTDRRPCPSCEARAAGCRSVEWLAGRYCCTSCTGDHDDRDTHGRFLAEHTTETPASPQNLSPEVGVTR